MKYFLRAPLIFLSLLLLRIPVNAQSYVPDPTFAPLLVKHKNVDVSGILVLPDDRILLRGYFGFVNNVPVKSLTRLYPDGSPDTTFRLAKEAESIALVALRPDGKILTGNLYNWPQDPKLALQLLEPNGKMIATMQTDLRGSLSLNGIFEVLPDNKILAGMISYEDGYAKTRLYRLNADGSTDLSFSTEGQKLGYTTGVAVQPDGKLLITGEFEHPGFPQPLKLIRLNADGSFDRTFSWFPNDQLFAVELQPDGKILLGRNSSQAGTGMIRLHPDGTVDEGFKAAPLPNGFAYDVYSIALQPDGRIVTGSWWQDPAEQNPYGHGLVMRLNPDGSLDAGFALGQGANYYVPHLALQQNGNILAGGSFKTYNGQQKPAILRLNGTNGSVDDAFTATLEAEGNVLSVLPRASGKLLAGGFFSKAANGLYRSLTRLNEDGTLDESFVAGPVDEAQFARNSDAVFIMAAQSDGKVVAGGFFSTTKPFQNNTGVKRFNADGAPDTLFTPGFPDHVPNYLMSFNLAVQQDDKILVSTIGGYGLTRMNADGTYDPSFQAGMEPNTSIYRTRVQPDGKILASGYIPDGNADKKIVRLNPDGTPDASFNVPPPDGAVVHVELLPDGRILIGGTFTSLSATPAVKLARLQADGTPDASFQSALGPADVVNNVFLQADGKLLVAGTFPALNRKVVRLNADGTMDQTFTISVPADFAFINAILRVENKILIASGGKLVRYTAPMTQAITFGPIPGKLTTDAPFTVSAVASSGLPVTLTVVSGPATIAGNTVTLTGTPGTVTLRAAQPGNEAYTPAPDAEQSFEVKAAAEPGPAAEVRVFPNPAPGQFMVKLPGDLRVDRIGLFDAMGKPVEALIVPMPFSYKVQARGARPGLYVLELQTGKGLISRRVLFK